PGWACGGGLVSLDAIPSGGRLVALWRGLTGPSTLRGVANVPTDSGQLHTRLFGDQEVLLSNRSLKQSEPSHGVRIRARRGRRNITTHGKYPKGLKATTHGLCPMGECRLSVA
ncbi:MAG: hypothetical protein WBX00_05265, partial [Isosphaeraceae bacterium]